MCLPTLLQWILHEWKSHCLQCIQYRLLFSVPFYSVCFVGHAPQEPYCTIALLCILILVGMLRLHNTVNFSYFYEVQHSIYFMKISVYSHTGLYFSPIYASNIIPYFQISGRPSSSYMWSIQFHILIWCSALTMLGCLTEGKEEKRRVLLYKKRGRSTHHGPKSTVPGQIRITAHTHKLHWYTSHQFGDEAPSRCDHAWYFL